MMRNLVLVPLLLLLGNYSFSQSLEIYDGYLGSSPVTFFLNLGENQVTGYYIYNKYGRPIPLKGNISDNRVILTEYSTANGKKENKEVATLTWYYSSPSKGRWSSGTRILELNLVARTLNVPWEMLNVKVELIHTFSDNKKMTYPITVVMNHPVSNDDGVFRILMSDFFNTERYYPGPWYYINDYLIDEYRNYLNFISQGTPERYFLELYGNVVYMSKSLLVYCTTGYAYSGGAHGQPLEEYSVYNLNNSSKLKFSDIFKEGAEYTLAEIVRAKDADRHDINNIRSNLDNFYITEKGIGFVFNPYDIDCYGCGTFEFFIGMEEIRHLLKMAL